MQNFNRRVTHVFSYGKDPPGHSSLGSKGKFQSWTDGRTSAKLEAPSPYCLTLSSPLLQIHLLRFPSSWAQAILFPDVLSAGVLTQII